MRRRPIGIGLALAGAYVLTLVVTMGLHGSRVRPLYEGFSPSAPYHWVNPPPVFAAGNQKPHSATASLAMTADGSVSAAINTFDAQVVLGLAIGAVAPRRGARSVKVAITPHDPAKLGPLPGGLRSDGNAYLIQFTYQPSGKPTGSLAKPGSMTLVIPEVATGLFTSPDGKRWTRVPFHNVPPTDLTLGVTFAVPGYYLAGTNLPAPAGPSSSSHTAVELGIGAAVLAAIVILAAFVITRRRRGASGA